MTAQPDPHQTPQADDARSILGTLPERWGRMDLMSRTALVEVGRVLQKEGLLDGSPPKLAPGWSGGLIIGTRFGSLAVDMEYIRTLQEGPGMASPHLFSYTLPTMPLAEAAIQYNLTGPVFSIISPDPYHDAQRTARQWLADCQGKPGVIITGTLDTLLVEDGFRISASLTLLYSTHT